MLRGNHRTRTCDLDVRSVALFPTELGSRAQRCGKVMVCVRINRIHVLSCDHRTVTTGAISFLPHHVDLYRCLHPPMLADT